MEAKGQIIDDTPIYYKDKEARDLLGDETLETEAQTCTGGINELKQSLTPNSTNMNYTDTYSIVKNMYSRSIIQVGAIKIATVCFDANKDTTAPTNSWIDLFTLPSGYEASNMLEVQALNGQNSTFNLGFRTNNNKIQYDMKTKGTTNQTILCQIVFV